MRTEHDCVVSRIRERTRSAILDIVEVGGTTGAVDDEVSFIGREVASTGSDTGDGAGMRSVVEVHLNVGVGAHRNASLRSAVRHSGLCGVRVDGQGDGHEGHDQGSLAVRHENISFPLLLP